MCTLEEDEGTKEIKVNKVKTKEKKVNIHRGLEVYRQRSLSC